MQGLPYSSWSPRIAVNADVYRDAIGSAAPEMQRLYASDWAAFSGWCVRHGEALGSMQSCGVLA